MIINSACDQINIEKSQDGEWGGHFEMFALSEALNIPICLFQETLNFITIGSFKKIKVKQYVSFIIGGEDVRRMP